MHLQTYLEEFKYNNTVYTDLWKHLQMVRYITIIMTALFNQNM